jgi:hypothetical protein
MTLARLDRRSTLLLTGGALGALLLPGCTTPVTNTTWPEITFNHKQPIQMSVNAVEIIDAAAMVEVEPPASNIGAALPVSPAATMQNWAYQRIAAAGGSGTAVVTITENRFVEVPLDTKGGVEGLFTVSQSERYEGALAVSVEIVGDPTGSGRIAARSAATRTVPEDFSINQREQALYDLVSGIVRTLDERLDQEIRAKLSRWVLFG